MYLFINYCFAKQKKSKQKRAKKKRKAGLNNKNNFKNFKMQIQLFLHNIQYCLASNVRAPFLKVTMSLKMCLQLTKFLLEKPRPRRGF